MEKEKLLELVENVNDAMSVLCGYLYENDLDELSTMIQEAISPAEALNIEDFGVEYEGRINNAVEAYFEGIE